MAQNVSITVNGVTCEREVEPRMLLVHFLREELGLTGTNIACDTSQCGSCTVLMDGKITAFKVKTFANLGGILSTIAPGVPTTLYGRILSGPYKIPHIYCNVIGTYTNTGMVDAYRGAGRPEATYVVERTMDLLANELNMDPV